MSAPVPTLADAMFSTPDVVRAMGDDRHLAALVAFEAALARAEGETGIISARDAAAITAALEAFPLPKDEERVALFSDAAKAGTIIVPFVKLLTRHVRAQAPDAAAFVHFGATSQDVIDTAHVLQIREALASIAADARRLIRAAAVLARAHRQTPMLGRTLMQPATPIPFGLKAAQWLAGTLDALRRVEREAVEALTLQFGGAAGSLGSLGAKGPEVAAALARELGLPLPAPALPWHARRGATAALGASLAVLCGHAGKIARDVSLMMQFEIGEVAEPSGGGRGGSSAMPHKRNPVRCMIALANATRAPGLAGSLLAGLVEEHERALGPWQAEWAIWPGLLGCTAGAVAAMAEALEGLEVDTERMAANLAALRGLPMTETVSLALAPKLGKEAAHAAVETSRKDGCRVTHRALRGAIERRRRHSCRFGRRDCRPDRSRRCSRRERCFYRCGPFSSGRDRYASLTKQSGRPARAVTSASHKCLDPRVLSVRCDRRRFR